MMDDPLISVITPTLNRADFIQKAVDSVTRQHYPFYEHIIVDGGSEDGTLDVLSGYPHLKVFSFSCSATEAQNYAIKQAKGDLVCFLNSDDYWLPDAFLAIKKMFHKTPEVDAFSGSYVVEERGHVIMRASLDHDSTDVMRLVYGAPGMGATFFKRSVFERMGPLRQDLTLANDRGFLSEFILKKGRSVIVPKHLVVLRQHSGSGTINDKGRLNSIIIQEHLMLSKELIHRTQGHNLRKYFQAWHAFEKAKEILDFLQKKNIFKALNLLKDFIASKEILTFIGYSVPLYVRWKIKNKKRVVHFG